MSIPRRAFLKTTLTTAGGLLGCNAQDQHTATESVPDSGQPEVRLVDGFEHFPQSVASGDPKPNSVVLWTRTSPSETEPSGDIQVELQLAEDADFEQRVLLDGVASLQLTAKAEHDYCLRVRVEELAPGKHYFYRFGIVGDNTLHISKTGRTKTAPHPESAEPIRFAVMSCQDYGGRYYHVHKFASQQDLDFVLFLGDYIYETAGDPTFQNEAGERQITFDDIDGALELQSERPEFSEAGEDSEAPRRFFAAKSVDNYRQLYRVYRSDPALQALHERVAMIAVWDDHEFSNDCHGETATYTAGREDERDPTRRANADQAWFEYMPVDYPAGPDFEFNREEPFPGNLRLYRDFEFGELLHIVVTDLRRYRSDHVIPEDALPGRIAIDAAELRSLVESTPDWAEPYIAVETFEGGHYRDELVLALNDQDNPDWDATQLTGNISALFINQLIEELSPGGELIVPLIDLEQSLPLGISYASANKTAQYGSTGSRYFLGFDAFQLIAKQRYIDTNGGSEDLLGEQQEQWFIETLQTSTKRWKIWGNEYTFMQRTGNLSGLPVPEGFDRPFAISGDDWDGAPNKRAQLLKEFQSVENLIAVTGDLHSFFAGNIGVDNGDALIEFVTGAVSSATYQALLTQGGIGLEGLENIAQLAGLILQGQNPHMAYQDLSSNGFAILEVTEGSVDVTLYGINHEKIAQPELDGELEQHFFAERFRVAHADTRLQHLGEDGWERWNPETRSWAKV